MPIHIIPVDHGYCTPLMRNNSANKLLFATLLKFESYYPPLCGIVQLTNSNTLRFRNWSFTTNSAPKLDNPASLRAWDSSSNKFQCATLLKLGTHYKRVSLKWSFTKNVQCSMSQIGSHFILDISRPIDGSYTNTLHGERIP